MNMLRRALDALCLAAVLATSGVSHVAANEVEGGAVEMPELDLFGAGGLQSVFQASMVTTANFTASTQASTTTTATISASEHPVATPTCTYPFEACSSRHHHEKQSLLPRLSKKSGKWDTNHPRYRLLKSIDAYLSYTRLQRAEIDRWREMYTHVPSSQKDLLEKAPGVVGYKQKLNKLEHLVDTNAKLCEDIASTAMRYYGISEKEMKDFVKAEKKVGRGSERASVVQGLKHFVRDWSLEGEGERRQAFPCVLEAVRSVRKDMMSEGEEGREHSEGGGKKLKVLLPGSGLGRLGHEVAALRGFEITINEWSSYMILPYRYLESHFSKNSNPTTFHPFIDSLSHHATNENLFHPVTLSYPPSTISHSSEVLLVEGDFTTVFSAGADTPRPQFDIIITHYFIDTARNLLDYLTTIHDLLPPGGAWVNFGPLLYGTGPWVQLSLDEVVLVSEHLGFEFEDLPDVKSEEEEHICGKFTFSDEAGGLGKVRGKYSGYQFDERALTKNAYIAQSWIARKKR